MAIKRTNTGYLNKFEIKLEGAPRAQTLAAGIDVYFMIC